MYNKSELAILYLDMCGLTYKTINEIVSDYASIEDIFSKSKQSKLIGKLTDAQLKFLSNHVTEEIENVITKDLDKYGIVAVTFLSAAYPQILKEIADPPFVLYCIGDTTLLKTQKIGIVGTRMPTSYGKDVANKFTKELVQAGLTTVSGLSYGIDTCCAVSSLAAGGKTIAVLAGGLDSIYPAQNVQLSKKIINNKGLLVSEYRPFVRPKQYSFLARNRIVSGLSDGLLVVEAGKKSGTKSTATYCVEQGRELFVVPGNITSPQSEGTNDLINEMPDCFTISTEQILSRLHIESKIVSQKQTLQLDFVSQQIVDFLSNEEKHFDDIAECLNISASTLSSTLTKLEIMGVIKKSSGNYYRIVF